MKKLSITKMADTIIAKRKEQKLTQAQLAKMTGINRGMISRLESCDYTPSIDQLQSIAEVLNFEVVDLFEDDKVTSSKPVLDKKYNIAVAGTGYVGLSIATLLSQHNHVTAVDIIPEKVDLINNRKSPIQDDYIEMYLAEKELDLTATLDGEEAYKNADFAFYVSTADMPTNAVLEYNPLQMDREYHPFDYTNHHIFLLQAPIYHSLEQVLLLKIFSSNSPLKTT